MKGRMDLVVRPRGVARRRFLAAIPAAVAGSLAAPAIARQQAQQARIEPATLDCAEKIFGVDFTDAEEQAAAAGVGRNLASFEQLRELNIPLDTEPAITFHPYLPGKRPKGPATPGAKMKVTLTPPAARSSSIEDLAFLPITSLAPLLQRRDISATDLTKMYLARLKRYGPKLQLRRHADGRSRAQAGRRGRREIRAGNTGARCTAFRGVRRICSRPRASRRRGARAISEPGLRLRRDDRGTARAPPAPCWCQAVDGRARAGR